MRQLRPDVWLLDLGWPAPFGSNGFLVDDGIDPESGERADGDVTLVDTGFRYSRRSIETELDDAGYRLTDIDRVLLTHYDLDHTGGLDAIAFDGPVYLGERDAELATGAWKPPLAHHKGLFHRVARKLFPLPAALDLRPVHDGERIGRFTAYHTPGHNPGHTVYVHDAGVGFLGDLVWEADGDLTTPFWGDSYDMHRLRESIRELANRCGEFELLCMGHGTPFLEGGSERLRGLADQL